MNKYLLLLASLFLVSCSTVAQITETASITEEEAYIEKYKTEATNFYNHLMLKPTLTSFFIINLKQVSEETKLKLKKRFASNINKAGLYSKIVSEDDSRDLIGREGRLNQKLGIYLDSLTMIAVSDRDIITPMGKKMGVDQILVIQFDQWPCADCTGTSSMRLKARLVDVERGLVFWTAIAEKEFTIEEFDLAEEISFKMIDELAEEFYHKYKIKWQHQRFNGLARIKNAG